MKKKFWFEATACHGSWSLLWEAGLETPRENDEKKIFHGGLNDEGVAESSPSFKSLVLLFSGLKERIGIEQKRKEAEMAKKKKKKSLKMRVAGYFGRLCFGSWVRTGVTLFALSMLGTCQWPNERVFSELASLIFLVFGFGWAVRKYMKTVFGL